MKLIVLRFVLFTVMVALGVATGVHTAWTQTYGKGVCKEKDCNKLPPIENDPTCGTETKPKKCIFKMDAQKGFVIYCDETTGKCELKDGPISNGCTGGCEDNLGKSCFSTAYNECKGAVKEK